MATARARLQSLSWYMKCLKEPLSRLANRQDKTRGAFFEGRFKSVAILDELARDNPSNLVITNHLPHALLNLGDVARSLDRSDEARKLYDRMVALTEPTVVENPNDPEYLTKLVGALWRLEARDDAADWVRRLRDAALADEDGTMLDGALATVATLEPIGGNA